MVSIAVEDKFIASDILMPIHIAMWMSVCSPINVYLIAA